MTTNKYDIYGIVNNVHQRAAAVEAGLVREVGFLSGLVSWIDPGRGAAVREVRPGEWEWRHIMKWYKDVRTEGVALRAYMDHMRSQPAATVPLAPALAPPDDAQTFSTNDEVRVKLTEEGAKVLARHNARFDNLPEKCRPPHLSAGDVWTGPLWEMAHIFGPRMFNGCDIPFESNRITIERRKP